MDAGEQSAGRRSRGRWILLGFFLLAALGALTWWLVPRTVSARRAAARQRLGLRLEAMALDLGGEGGELGACLLGLGEPQPAPGDWAVSELRDFDAPDWACEEVVLEEWPLFAPSIPLERCDGVATARWHSDPEPFYPHGRELKRRFVRALREPDPNRRLEAVRPALRMMVASHRVFAGDDYIGFSHAPLKAATWLGGADPDLRRALAADLRRWVTELPDERFLLASAAYRRDLSWRPVGWSDLPFPGGELRDAVEGPLGLVGSDWSSVPTRGPLFHASDEMTRDALWGTPTWQARGLLAAALLLEGQPAEVTFRGARIAVEVVDGELCLPRQLLSPLCVRPEWKNTRRIAIDREVQELARNTFPREMPESIVRRVLPLPEGEYAVPIIVDSRRGPPDQFGYGVPRLDLRVRVDTPQGQSECTAVVVPSGQGQLRFNSRAEPPDWDAPAVVPE